MDQILIGSYIAQKRKEKNMTQAKLAERLGVSNKTVSKWETGKCIPDYSVIEPLCSELGLTGPFFGVPDFINSVKNVDKEFYLVNTDDRQFLVMVTDEFIESRQLAGKVSENSFVIGNFKFTVCKKTISFKAD